MPAKLASSPIHPLCDGRSQLGYSSVGKPSSDLKDPCYNSPSRQQPRTGEFVYYDCVDATVSHAHAFECCIIPRTISAGHSTGFMLSDIQ